MISLATAEVRLDAPPLKKDDLEARAIRLFEEWDAYLASSLPVEDYALLLELEEGSITAKTVVRTSIKYAFNALIVIGGVTAGIREVNKMMRQRGDYFVELVGKQVPEGQLKSPPAKGTGELGRVENLLRRVKKGELTPEEAAARVNDIFATDSDATPEILEALQKAIREVRRDPKQLRLFDDRELPEPPGKEKLPRHKRPQEVPLPAPMQAFRVEVYRDSKTGKREVRVVPL